MSKRVFHKCLCLVACSVITVCAGTTVLAEAAAEETSAEATMTEEAAAREIVFILQGNEISIENQTADQADTSVVEAEEGAAEAKVIITLADGSEHMFENVKADILDGAVFTEDHGFYYLTAKDTDGSNTEFTETAEPVPAKGDQSMWVTTDVNIREEADSDAAIVTVASIGGECKVISFLPGWVQVDYNGSEGYIRHKFLVDDKAAADAALASEQAAQAALAAQTQTYSYDYSGSYGGGGYSGGGSTGGGNAGGGSDACVTNGLLN